MDEGFLKATSMPWLIVDRVGLIVSANSSLLEMLGWTTVPAGGRLGDVFAFDINEAWQSKGSWKRFEGNFMSATGERNRMICLSFCQRDQLLLFIEGAHSISSTGAMHVMSKLNDELVSVTRELQKKKSELEHALERVRTLEGILPICSSCKQIRVDDDHWEPVDVYVSQHSKAKFSHGICPICAKRLYPDYIDE